MKIKNIVIAVIAFLASMGIVIAVGLMFLGRNNTDVQIREQLELGQRYLSEMKYEEAIVAFRKVIELDPKNTEAYVSLADAYAENGQLEEALEVLENAPEDVDDPDAIEEKIDEIEQLMEGQRAAAAETAAKETEASDGGDGVNLGQEDDGETAAASETTEEAQAEPELNEYGAVVFEQRTGYMEFDQIPAEEQEFIIACAQAAIRQDEEALRELMETREPEYYYLTKWNGYKVSVSMGIPSDGDARQRLTELGLTLPEDVESHGRALNVELRPETGTGYWGYVMERYGFFSDYGYSSDDMGNILPGSIRYNVGTEQKTFLAECNCADWQWDGELTLDQSIIEEKVRRQEGEITTESLPRHEYETVTTTGTMRRGLRDGDFKIISDSQSFTETADGSLVPGRYNDDGVITVLNHYENGISESGLPDWRIGLFYNFKTTEENPWVLAGFYW